MEKVPYMYSPDSGKISLYIEGKPYNVGLSHINYDEILKAIKSGSFEGLKNLVDIPSFLASAGKGKVVIENGAVYCNGAEVHNVMVDRIIEFIRLGFPVNGLVAFLENLLLNPNENAVNELYVFLEKSDLPLTEDGHFLAYKKVDANYKSYHKCPDGSSLDHPIGALIQMDRVECNPNRDETCSRGLHFCSLRYLPRYHGGQGRVVVLKINPKDVVTIPSDYNQAKGRACEYTVFAEYVSDEREHKEAFNTPYVDTSEKLKVADIVQDVVAADGDFGTKPSGQKFYQRRGAGGKFTKRS